MIINIEEIEVKIKFIDQKNLKAIMSVTFGEIIIKGFRIKDSKYKNDNGDKLWLIVPSYADSGGKYHPIFFIPNKELWKKIEKKLWEEYYKQKEEYYKKQFDL